MGKQPRLKNLSPGRSKTQVELEIERRLNPVQSGYGRNDSGGIRLHGQVVDYKPVTVTADYTATGREGMILVDASNGTVIITFPAVSSSGYNKIEVKKIDDTRNAVIVKSASLTDKFESDESEVSIDVQNDSLTIAKKSSTERVLL